MQAGNQSVPLTGNAKNLTSALTAALQVVVAGLVILVAVLVTKGLRWRHEASLGGALAGELQKSELALKSLLLDAYQYQQNQARPNQELEQFFRRIGLNVQVKPANPSPVPPLPTPR